MTGIEYILIEAVHIVICVVLSLFYVIAFAIIMIGMLLYFASRTPKR